ncbi:TPA: hypothetical protein I7272_16355 [Vibrio parahaemolyticus]|nr:hypothetical protein [Vibrio parahaemolyticus]HAS6694637.1 hypothetical protein [Vibrio parahaemolyticus]
MFDQVERQNINSALPTYLDKMTSIQIKEANLTVMHELHCEFTASIMEIMRYYNTLFRLPDLLRDYELFIEDMRRKYSTTQEYGYPVRSPNEKLKGISFPDFNGQALTRLKKRKQEQNWSSFDF